MPIETVFSTWTQFLGASLVLACAQSVYVLFGFGAGLIAVGGMAMFLPRVTDVVVLLLLLSLPAELLVVGRSRHQIAWREVLIIFSGASVGALLGSHLLARSAPGVLLTLLAIFLVVAGATFLLVRGRRVVRWPAEHGSRVALAHRERSTNS